MMIHGWCTKCNKIKRVHATNAAMVNLAMNRPIWGVCSSCEEAERAAARDRHPSRRGRRDAGHTPSV